MNTKGQRPPEFSLSGMSSHHQLKHVANHEARVVRHNLLQDWYDVGALMPSDHRYVPSAVFTDPQIASVGMTENEARASGFDISVKVQDFADVAYGWAMEDTTGFAKVIVETGTGRILGAHIMGHQASSLIQPLIQAMVSGSEPRTWPAVGTGFTWLCRKSSRMPCWRCAVSLRGLHRDGTSREGTSRRGGRTTSLRCARIARPARPPARSGRKGRR